MPPATDLAKVMRSGSSPTTGEANIEPVRPKPVWISSAMSTMPYLSQKARSCLASSGGTGMKPPSPKTGSTMTAATADGSTMFLSRSWNGA